MPSSRRAANLRRSWVGWAGAALVAVAVAASVASAPSASRPAATQPIGSQPTTAPANPRHIEARRFYDEGVRLLRERSYAAALLHLRASVEFHPDGPRAAAARGLVEDIEREALARLSLARDLVGQKRLRLAREQFQAVGEAFAGTAAAAAAAEEEKALVATPAYLKESREADGRALLEKARAQDQQGQVYFASLVYRRIVEHYGDTAAAAAARTRLAEIAANPRLTALLDAQKAEQEAAEWFAMAENYRANAERLDGADRRQFAARAREWYNRLLAAHPASPLAEKARAGLEKLRALERTHDSTNSEKGVGDADCEVLDGGVPDPFFRPAIVPVGGFWTLAEGT